MAWLRFVSVAALLPAALLCSACDRSIDDPDDIEDGDLEAHDDDEEEISEDPADPEDPEEPEEPTGPQEPADPPAPKPEAAVSCDLNNWGGYECTTDDGVQGTNFCILVDGEEFYTPCTTAEPECEPGENYDMGCIGEICYWDGEEFKRYSWSEPDCNTPLVVDFDGGPLEFAPAAAASFDLSTDGTCMSTDWPTAPWLALDRDGDGFIRSGSELFGSATPMASGGYASHGFAALAELDSDHDGKITANDDRFHELVLWSDLDDDRLGAYDELRPVSETSLVAIDLSFDRKASCDDRGNCGYERASFEYRMPQGGFATGEVVDVHVACR